MPKPISAKEFDRVFDEGEEDIMQYLDLSSARRVNDASAQRQINVSMTPAMLAALDAEAERVGVNRQAVIKMWLQERIDSEADRRARWNSVA